MSIQGVRKLKQDQRNLIDQTWKNIQPLMRAAPDQYNSILRWSNMYINDKFKVDFPNKQQWLELAKSLTEQIFPNNKILTTGFVLNPPNSKKNQVWHTDYQNVNTMFIPLVDQSCQNATQVINFPITKKGKMSPLGYQCHYGHDALQIMDNEGLDFMTISQVICRSHTILKMPGGSVHRGILNRQNYERVLFYIMCSDSKTSLNQEQFVQSNMLIKNK